MKRKSLVTSGAVLVLALMGCGAEAVEVGELQPLPLQATRRFPVGSTYYLPDPVAGRWELEGAPEGNTNVVVAGKDGFSRFTPVVAGEYGFRIAGSEERRSLTAVSEVPYEHYNYYATTSLAQVGEELWVAHLYDPQISRIDPTTGKLLGSIASGPWPAALAWSEAQGVALVAHKAGDTLGVIDVEAGRLIDAVWVGDEPAAVVVSPDGATAYVSLAKEDAVVVVDIASRAVTGRVAANKNATALAMSADGATLYVASYCSGVGDRQQFAADPRNDKFDIAVIDTATLKVTGHIGEVGSVLGGLLLAEDRLYVATTRVAVRELSGTEGMTAFRHTVAAYDPKSLKEVAAVDVGRQDSATALAVRPFGMALAGGSLWVSFEGTDEVVGLDPKSLAERGRFAAEGRPRTVLASGEKLFVHGAQGYAVTVASAAGKVEQVIALEGDPREAGVAAGQALYTGTGAKAGVSHSCADCHVDGLTDGNVWSAGGFSESASRPMFWLEGRAAIGWEGDAHDLFSYLYGSPGPTIGATISTELHQAFYDYLAAFVPPPPANGATERDGSFTAAALRGEAVFRGKANCVGCHAGPLATQGLRLPGGGTQTDHPIVVPSLIGAYRHGHWLVNGAAWTLEEAVDAMLKLSAGRVDASEKEDLVRYLQELTAREFFVLGTTPTAGAKQVRSAGPLQVTLSHPVFVDPENLARVRLVDADGAEVAITVTGEGRHLTVVPDAALKAGGAYTLVVGAGFEAWSERTLAADHEVGFTVAAAPALQLDGEYVLTVEHPNLDRENKRYDPSVIIPVEVALQATANGYGATIVETVTPLLTSTLDVVVAGETSYWPPFPFPVGPGFLNRSFPSEMLLVDDDADGVADRGESTLLLRSPGLEADGVVWRIARPGVEPTECAGAEGEHVVELATDDAGVPTVSWTDDVTALGYYVTDVAAKTPLGPGPVTEGETYWALSTASFPTGFAGPVVYGELPAGATDVSEDSMAPMGGAPLPGASCVKLTLVFSDFKSTVLRYETP